MKKTLLGLALATAAFAGAANAAPVYPVSVVSQNQGVISHVAADRSDATVLFDAFNHGDAFYSLGLGGNLVLDFGSNLYGVGKVIEITYKLANYLESMDVYVSNSTTFSGGPVATISNQNAEETKGGVTFLVNTPFRYIKLVDTSAITNDKNRDGFDVAEISFSPVPVPAAGLMLAGAVAGLGALRRRAKKA